MRMDHADLLTLGRQVFRAGIRRARGSDLPRIVFLHVPKTGGTSLENVLRIAYGRRQSYRVDEALTSRAIHTLHASGAGSTDLDKFRIREALLLVEMTRGTRYISGHVHFHPEFHRAFADRYRWITVLRDPVKRYVSQYFFDANKTGEHAMVTEDIRDFVWSERGARRSQNYVNYFGNFYRADSTPPEVKLEAAQANLHKLALVGFLDDLPGFEKKLHERLGIGVRFPHLNRNPVARPDVDPATLDRIRELCRYDLELFEYARRQFA